MSEHSNTERDPERQRRERLEPAMPQIVNFIVAPIDDDPEFDWFDEEMRRAFNGQVIECSQPFIGPGTVTSAALITVEFDTYDDALDAANNYQPNDRLIEAAPSEPDMCRLSEQSLWTLGTAFAILERYQERVQSAAQ